MPERTATSRSPAIPDISACLRLTGQPLVLKNINIAPEPKTGEVARLGEDVLATYSAVVFDFNAMAFSISW